MGVTYTFGLNPNHALVFADTADDAINLAIDIVIRRLHFLIGFDGTINDDNTRPSPAENLVSSTDEDGPVFEFYRQYMTPLSRSATPPDPVIHGPGTDQGENAGSGSIGWFVTMTQTVTIDPNTVAIPPVPPRVFGFIVQAAEQLVSQGVVSHSQQVPFWTALLNNDLPTLHNMLRVLSNTRPRAGLALVKFLGAFFLKQVAENPANYTASCVVNCPSSSMSSMNMGSSSSSP